MADTTANTAEELKAHATKQLHAGNYSHALHLLTQALEIEPRNKSLYAARSRAYAKEGRNEEARTDARICIDIDPTYSTGWLRLSRAFINQNNVVSAKKVVEEGLRICQDKHYLGLALANIDEHLNQRATTIRRIKSRRVSSFSELPPPE